MRTIRILLVTAVMAGVAFAPQSASAREQFTMAEVLVDALSAEIQRAGLSPDAFLNGRVTLRTTTADGTVSEESLTMKVAIERLSDPVGGLPIARDDGADGGSSAVVNAGDMFHLYANFAFGSALAYDVSTSAVVPSTPPVIVDPRLFDVGGPTRNVRASGYLVGAHTTGTAFGSNVDTSPGPTPVGWLPLVSSGVVSDRTLDFAGHAIVAQAEFCLFGICVAAGALAATGVTLFDNETDLAIPTIP